MCAAKGVVHLFAPELYIGCHPINILLIMECSSDVPIDWSVKREQICDCGRVQVPVGISHFEMKHTCFHRACVTIEPSGATVYPGQPVVMMIQFQYTLVGHSTLCYKMAVGTRIITLFLHVKAYDKDSSTLAPLRKTFRNPEIIAELKCGRVPIDNLDPVIRVLWLYNPTCKNAIWNITKVEKNNKNRELACLLYYAIIPPACRFGVPFAFQPREMKKYKLLLEVSLGTEVGKILVSGEGYLSNTLCSRLDVPTSMTKIIRYFHRIRQIYLSEEYFVIPPLLTHSLHRELFAIINDTESHLCFEWITETISNVVELSVSPGSGLIGPGTTQWLILTVNTLQEASALTITVACRVYNISAMKEYQRNNYLKWYKGEICKQEFVIKDDGIVTHPNTKDVGTKLPDLPEPRPAYLALDVSLLTIGQRDHHEILTVKQLYEREPPFDIFTCGSCNSVYDFMEKCDMKNLRNVMCTSNILRVIDGILWNVLNGKKFKDALVTCLQEETPTYYNLMKIIYDKKKQFNKRTTGGVGNAMVCSALFDIFATTTTKTFID